jgi:hypothetical protein
MVTYNRNKKGVRDDRISSIQIRWVKKKKRANEKGERGGQENMSHGFYA